MRPFVHVNCAMSADGKIAGTDRRQVSVSSGEDKARVRTLRKQYDSVLVGVGTVIADDPHLTVKGLSYDENPVRIVLDPNGRTPDDALVVNSSAPTVIITNGNCTRTWKDVNVIRSGKSIELSDVLDRLSVLGIESILVEGGGETIASFFHEGFVDRYTVFVGSLIIGGRSSPTPVDGEGWAGIGGIELTLADTEILGDGVLLTYVPTGRAR